MQGNPQPQWEEQNPKLRRDLSYRARHFPQNRGFRIWIRDGIRPCPYCGRLMRDKRKTGAGRIVSVRRAQTDRRLRAKFSGPACGANDAPNLVARCSRCNARKGKRGGLWALRGRHGHMAGCFHDRRPAVTAAAAGAPSERCRSPPKRAYPQLPAGTPEPKAGHKNKEERK